jgi:uncharacterized protein (TIRG00374 family)
VGKLEKRILWGVVIGAIVYAGIALFADASELAHLMAGFPLSIFVLALGLTLVNYGLRFIKWHAFLRRLGFQVGVGESLNVFLAGLVMSVTPGKVGEVLKSLLLKNRHGFPVSRTAPIVFAERVTDLLGLFIMAGVGIATFDYARWAFAVSLAVVLGIIVVLNQRGLVHRILDFFDRFERLESIRTKLEEAYDSTYELLRWKLLSWTTLLSVAAWSMEAVAFYYILEALQGQGVTPLAALFIYSITTILGAVSFLPGGLGVAEGSMIGVLLLFGIFASETPAAVATYLIRFSTLWFGVIVGFFALIVYRMRGAPMTIDDEEVDEAVGSD